MFGLTPALMLILGLPALALHIAMVLLTRALRTYSRIRLEEYSAERGHLQRAQEIGYLDERTEQSAEALAVLSGLFAAALLGALVERSSAPAELLWVIVLVLLLGAVGYLGAGVLGRIFAEPILDAAWPATRVVRALAVPLETLRASLESITKRLAPGAEHSSRPASVEVEVPTEEGETTEDVEAELSDEARNLLQHAIALSRRDVSEVMKPAREIISLPETVTAAAASEVFRRTGRSRIPIFGSSHDHILGILIAKDLWDRMASAIDPTSIVPARLIRPAFFVPRTANAFELIGLLRQHRTQMAIIIDEYGGVVGLVTLEDLLEQFVGPIEDEHDEPGQKDAVTHLGGSRYEVDAGTPLEVLNERFGLRLPTQEDFETIGGLALHALGRLPEDGASFRFGGVEFTVLDVRDRSIRRVIMDLQPAATMAGGA